MGLKGAKRKQQQRDLKKTLKAAEPCPYCKKKKLFSDLDEHLKREHPFKCARCGVRFSTEWQWKQHARDMHGLDWDQADRDDRHKKIERWLTDQPKAAAARTMACEDEPQISTQVCEECGAKVSCAFDFSGQGLSFKCCLIGQQCGSSKGQGDLAAGGGGFSQLRMQACAGAPPPAPVVPGPGASYGAATAPPSAFSPFGTTLAAAPGSGIACWPFLAQDAARAPAATAEAQRVPVPMGDSDDDL